MVKTKENQAELMIKEVKMGIATTKTSKIGIKNRIKLQKKIYQPVNETMIWWSITKTMEISKVCRSSMRKTSHSSQLSI